MSKSKGVRRQREIQTVLMLQRRREGLSWSKIAKLFKSDRRNVRRRILDYTKREIALATVMQEWTTQIGLRHQGVLIAMMRGCDSAERDDNSKKLHRLYRGAVVYPHSGRFIQPATYIMYEPDQNAWWTIAKGFLNSHDHYPNHYVMHLIHAAEVIGYCGPEDFPVYSNRWRDFYLAMVHCFHLNPETKEQMDARLDADEESFARLQVVT